MPFFVTVVGKVGSSYNMRHVNIGGVLGDNDIHVWTFSSNEHVNGIPIVLLHGLGSGLALWAINLKTLTESKSRPVYAIDIPGNKQRKHYVLNPGHFKLAFQITQLQGLVGVLDQITAAFRKKQKINFFK